MASKADQPVNSDAPADVKRLVNHYMLWKLLASIRKTVIVPAENVYHRPIAFLAHTATLTVIWDVN